MEERKEEERIPEEDKSKVG
jgi:hypothetical protein